MAFRGIYPAPSLAPSPVGLFSVADVMTHTARGYDERWIRGFSHEYDSVPTVRLLTVNDETVTGGEIHDGSYDASYQDYTPFFIEVESLSSTFGLPGEDRFATVLKQLEAASQKAVELELWDGVAAQGEVTTNPYLTKTSAATEVSNGAHDASEALYLLEGALANSPVGANGVIHMTRDVASLLGSRLIYVPDSNDAKKGRVMTRLGTDVVIGSGYSGNGPVGDGAATASLTNKWMFATGPVSVHLSKPEVVNDSLAQGANVSINDMRIKAVRAAAVYFDPSCHYSAQVTLPSVA